MTRAVIISAFALLIAPGGATAAPSAEHALYLAQRYAHAGFFGRAFELARGAASVVPGCTAIVKMRARGRVLPLCAPSALRPPAAVAARIASLRRLAASAAPARAAALLEQAWRLDPFDDATVLPLARALRASGRERDARQIEAEAAALRRGNAVLRTERRGSARRGP